MSAFGRRPGTAGRPAFGVAKPMQGGSGGPGGSQFPAIDTPPPIDIPQMPSNMSPEEEAMERLNMRSTAEAIEPEKAQGFEASVHKIKEQVLPRLLERVDPEAAATLSKDELTEEFRPIILEVLAELRITLNRREQFALEKVLVDELLGFGPLEELLQDPDISDIMVNGPYQTYIEKKGQLMIAPIQFRDEEHLFQIAQRIVNQVGRRVDQTTPLADARLKDGSRVNVIVPPLSACAVPPSRFVSFPKSRSRSTTSRTGARCRRRWQPRSRSQAPAASTSSSRAVPVRARPRCSTRCRR